MPVRRRTRIRYLAEGSPDQFRYVGPKDAISTAVPVPVVHPPGMCRECEHFQDRGCNVGYAPLCELMVNSRGQPCAALFDAAIRDGRPPDDPRCPWRSALHD